MYLPNGELQSTLLCKFPAVTKVKPNFAWLSELGGIWRVGTVNGEVWKQVEGAWAQDTYGNWMGAPPILTQAIDLKIVSNAGVVIPRERQGDEWITRVPSSQSFSLMWLRQSLVKPQGVSDNKNAVGTIYNAATGAAVVSVDAPEVPWTVMGLPNGSYTAHIYYTGIVEGLRIPPGAKRDPAYNYTTEDGRSSHYNPYLNWGEVPANPDHPLRVLRQELIMDNLTEDVKEYAPYVTSEEARTGEGSMLLFQIGPGAWSRGDDVFVSPARALYELDFTTPLGSSPSTPIAKAFDPLVSQLTYPLRLRSGELLLGGARMTKDGPCPAIWSWDEDSETATFLAITENACDPICEQMLSTGGIVGMVERTDGTIIVLTLCSKHRFRRDASTPEERLPRYPSSVDGEPGGRSLVVHGNQIQHLTERFGDEILDSETESFYNLLIDVQGDTQRKSAGTVAQVDSALWNHRNKSYGIRANAAPTEEGAKLYITYYDGTWNKSANSWRADWIYLSRGVSVNGRNLSFGFQPGSETALSIVSANGRDKVSYFDYRVRGLTITEGGRIGYRQAVCPARLVLSPTQLEPDWSVIALDGRFVGEEWEEPIPPTPSETTVYRVISLKASETNPIYTIHLKDLTDGELSLLNSTNGGNYILYRVDSEEPIDDLNTYLYKANLGGPTYLPIEARSWVDVIVFWEAALGPLELPILSQRD